jgi:hypothetical protein
MSKTGRNDPCPCGSGKKYKKCCEEKIKHKKFQAQVLTQGLSLQPQNPEVTKTSSMFFQRAITQINAKPSEQPPDEEKNPVM